MMRVRLGGAPCKRIFKARGGESSLTQLFKSRSGFARKEVFAWASADAHVLRAVSFVFS